VSLGAGANGRADVGLRTASSFFSESFWDTLAIGPTGKQS